MNFALCHYVFSHECKLISITPDIVLEPAMYTVQTQLLDIPNYQVISADTRSGKITLDIESVS